MDVVEDWNSRQSRSGPPSRLEDRDTFWTSSYRGLNQTDLSVFGNVKGGKDLCLLPTRYPNVLDRRVIEDLTHRLGSSRPPFTIGYLPFSILFPCLFNKGKGGRLPD